MALNGQHQDRFAAKENMNKNYIYARTLYLYYMRKRNIAYLASLLCGIFSAMPLRAASENDSVSYSMVIQTKEGITHILPVNSIKDVTYLINEKTISDCENEAAKAYLNDFEYDSNDYSYSNITTYANIAKTGGYRGDQPVATTIELSENERCDGPLILHITSSDGSVFSRDTLTTVGTSIQILNLIPGETYSYYLHDVRNNQTVKCGTVMQKGQLRMMNVDGGFNIRDLGGWELSGGGRIKYGRIFRGGELEYSTRTYGPELTAAGVDYMKRVMKIGVDFDLREAYELRRNDNDSSNDIKGSALGDDVTYVHYSNARYLQHIPEKPTLFATCLRSILTHLNNGRNIYIHCVNGRDRTGVIAFLIEGLLGASEDALSKDYELTTMYELNAFRTNEDFQTAINHIKSLTGKTLRDKFDSYARSIGFSATDVEKLRQQLIEYK